MARRVLPGIISLIPEAGSLVLIEGIETVEEAKIAMDIDADLVQGYYFGHPASQLQQTTDSPRIGELFRQLQEKVLQESQHKRLGMYSEAFADAAGKLQAGFALEQACASLLNLAGSDR